MTDTPADDSDDSVRLFDRRDVLTTAAAIAGAGAIGVYAGSAGVVAAPTGTFPESTDDPLLKIRADRIRLVPRTSDPSVSDGVLFYNESA